MIMVMQTRVCMWKEEVGHRRTKGDGREGLGNATVTKWLIGHTRPKTCDTSSLTMARNEDESDWGGADSGDLKIKYNGEGWVCVWYEEDRGMIGYFKISSMSPGDWLATCVPRHEPDHHGQWERDDDELDEKVADVGGSQMVKNDKRMNMNLRKT